MRQFVAFCMGGKPMIKASIEKLDGLTPREARVLQAICDGLSNQAIADRLAISIKTVDRHIDNIYDKLQVRAASIHTRSAAIVTAIARGIVVLSTRALCIWLMVSAAGIDDQVARVGRTRLPRVQIMRVRRKDDA